MPVDNIPNNKRQLRIPVVVVESHQHVLEHVHHVLRKTGILKKPWNMLHFDAHPDLACPSAGVVSAKDCFQPRRNPDKSLYDCLDQTASGIAEWILPLVLAANLRRIAWIHQPASTVEQFPEGEHSFNVGVWEPNQANVSSFLDLSEESSIKVDCPYRYYREDDCTVPSEELTLKAPLELHVSAGKPIGAMSDNNGHRVKNWMLDVCLDYFACMNPFVTEMEERNPAYAKAFVNAIQHTRFYQEHVLDDPQALSDFRQNFSGLLQKCLGKECDDNSTVENLLSKLSSLSYTDQDRGKALLSAIVAELQQSNASPDTRDLLVRLSLEALPNASLPHRWKEDSTDSETESWSVLGESLGKTPSGAPFVVTVARSSEDGFTPVVEVEDLQNRLLRLLHDRYCGCTFRTDFSPSNDDSHMSCRLHILYDYGAWEGSTF